MIRKLLQAKWDEFKKIDFPPALDDLEIKSDLAELDSYVAGLVSIYLSGVCIEKPLILDKNLDRKLKEFNPKTEHDKKYYLYYIQYKSKIDELSILLNKACFGKNREG